MGQQVVTWTVTGKDKTTPSLHRLLQIDIAAIMESCGQEGMRALADHTPVDTGLASHGWYYEVVASAGHYAITWNNYDIENGFPVVIMLQYGHGTGTGGYVQGRDFINPAIRPVFDKIQDKVWKAVTSA